MLIETPASDLTMSNVYMALVREELVPNDEMDMKVDRCNTTMAHIGSGGTVSANGSSCGHIKA